VKKKAEKVGSMDQAMDTDILRCFHGARIEKGGTPVYQFMSCSFDPSTLRCITCEREHAVGGEGECFALSDQNFLASLPGNSEKKCMNIVRIENGSLTELADIFCEIFDGRKIAPGTCVLLGSLSYLGRVGASIYAQEWRGVVHMLQRKWGGIQVCPLIHIMTSEISGNMMNEILTIAHWFQKVYEGTTNGLTVPWSHFIDSLTSSCEGESMLDSPELFTFPLPASLDITSPITPWKFTSSSTSPVMVYGPDRKAVHELVCALAVALDRDFSITANPGIILQREPASNCSESTKDNQLKNLVLIGGSNLKKMSPVFKMGSLKVLDLTQPGWLLTDSSIKNVVEELKKWLPGTVGMTGVILDIFGNSSVKFRHVDGALVLPMKVDGKYHLLGDVVIETDTGIKTLLKTAEPLLEEVAGMPTLVNPPHPRFVFTSCCRDNTHAPNTRDDSHQSTMLNGFAHFRSMVKSELVSSGTLKHFWVLESLSSLGTVPDSMADKLAGLRHSLGQDGVHLTDFGLNNLYRNMSQAMANILDRMSKAGKDEKSCSAPILVSGGSFYWRGFTSPAGSIRRPHLTSMNTRGGRGGRGRGSGGRAFAGVGGSFGGGSRNRSGHGGTPYDRHGSKTN
jgi:uncharacterized membrane protein YgcG